MSVAPFSKKSAQFYSQLRRSINSIRPLLWRTGREGSETASAYVTRVNGMSVTGKVIVLFRTCASQTAPGEPWQIPIHTWIFDPQRQSRLQRATLSLFRRYLSFKTKTPANDLFHTRTQAFFVANQRGQALDVRFGGQEFRLGKSGSNGHLKGVVHVPHSIVAKDWNALGADSGWCEFSASLPGEEQVFHGRVLCLPPRGLSIISDIDDTIKHSHVRNRKELLTNTFHREFQPVPEMAPLYREWAATGIPFHYVSSSPWQLHEPLCEFLEQEGFPLGTLHLKFFRLRDARVFKPFVRKRETKARNLQLLLQQFPQRKFVLIGDSGERDPEIYGQAARKHPGQIVRIAIREVAGHTSPARRYQRAFRGLPQQNSLVFREIEELSRWLPASELPKLGQ